MEKKKWISAEALLLAVRDDPEINGKNFARIRKHIDNTAAVEAMTMTDKEKLTQLIEAALDEGFSKHIPLTADFLADRLIAGGVIFDKEEEK